VRPAPSPSRLITSAMIVLALVAVMAATVRLTRPRESVAVLGDSLTALAKSQITSAGHDSGYAMAVDGIAGITLEERMGSVDALSHHTSGPVVIELGTNDVLQGATAEDLAARADQAMAALAADRCVVFVTVGILYDVDGRAAGFNDHLRQAIGSHPNMHVLDWDREFKAHPDWSSDTVHLKPEHFSRYADAIIGAVRNDC